MAILNSDNLGEILAEYKLGSTKVRIRDSGNAYANLSDEEKKFRDYKIGSTVLKLFFESETEKTI